MGSISKLANGKYRARYRDPDGRQKAAHFSRKVDAENWLTTKSASMLDGSYVDPAAGRMMFGVYAGDWTDRQVHRPTTRAQVGSHMKNHILPTFEHRTLVSIRPSEVQTWVRAMQDKLAPATVAVVYGYFAGVLKSAVDDRLISRTPCRSIKLPKAEKKLVVPLPVEQVRALAEAVPRRYRTLVMLAATTGMRQGECFGLRVSSLDTLRRQIHVTHQLVLVPGRPPYLGPPKTASSVRVIPIPAFLVEDLAAHLSEFGSGELDLVFTDEQGHPLRRNRFSERVWRPAVEKAKVRQGTVFHDLRHHYASLLIRHGESVKTVQHRLGHASAMETLDTYGHLWPDSEERTREVIEGEWMEDYSRDGEDSVRTTHGQPG